MNIGDKYRQHYLDIYPGARRSPGKRWAARAIGLLMLAGLAVLFYPPPA